MTCFRHLFVFSRSVYESTYTFCHDENDVMTLTSDATGNEAFEQFLDKITHKLNKQWEENDGATEDVSKDDRHVLRLAAVMHVFYGQLLNKLDRLPASSPPSVVSAETLKRAIALTHYFAKQRKVLDQVLTNIK